MELTKKVISKYTTPNLFGKYEKYKKNKEVNMNPLLLWCPSLKCNKVIKIKKENDGKVSCDKCKTEVCTKCGKIFHAPKKCSEMADNTLFEWGEKKDFA